jgi:uncharacterized protein (DUF433 family)
VRAPGLRIQARPTIDEDQWFAGFVSSEAVAFTGHGGSSRLHLRKPALKLCSRTTTVPMRSENQKESPMDPLNRITQQPEVMGGKACIRGMRVTVGLIVGQIGAGHTIDEVLTDYPYLEREDILQALRYAAWRAEEREVVLATA